MINLFLFFSQNLFQNNGNTAIDKSIITKGSNEISGIFIDSEGINLLLFIISVKVHVLLQHHATCCMVNYKSLRMME